MKLYVIPVGSKCNARCKFCITKYRKMKNNYLNVHKLKEVLSGNNFTKIEITGGGEPGLHPKIEQIINICTEHAPTQIYTNGTYTPPANSPLALYCLSRAHHENSKNQKIMGVKYTMDDINANKVPIKLSLITHQSGISDEKDIVEYLKWARSYADKVVVRQLFEYENEIYTKMFAQEFVDNSGLFKNRPFTNVNGNRTMNINGVKVEIEERSCACENTSPVLLASSNLQKGWATQ